MTKQGQWLRKSKNGLNVVFIHGINSSDECWKSKKGAYWPELLIADSDLEEIGIYLFSYRTGFSTGSYNLGDIVDSLNEYLSNLDEVLNSDRVIFVCHSMGGIIARHFLVREQSNFIEKGLKYIGFFLVASPSLGSEYANMLSLVSAFLGHTQAKALKFTQNNVWLNDLDRDFINLKDANRLNIIGKELIEDVSLKIIRFLGLKKQIVEPFSGARYFGQSFKVPGSDHITIAKPESKDAIQHRLLIEFIKDFEKIYNSTETQASKTTDQGRAKLNPPTVVPSNLPRSGVKEFVGRIQKLQELQEQLQNSQRIAITAISGMGGIGKTELALQYAIAQLEQERYPGGFCWLRVRDQEIATQIVSFAQTKLGLTLPDGLDEKGQVDYCWGHWREGDVLVVLDDVTEFDAVEPYLPPSDPKFKVLITTRLNLGSSVQALSIEELDDESALALLKTFVGQERIDSQLEDAKTLCGWVGNLPLGLELLGRFLARKPDWSFEKLIERLESKRLEANALVGKEPGMTAQLGVAAALELSWVELSEAEQELARLLGMFAVAPIPWTLVEGCLSELDQDDLEDIRDEGLRDRNLLKRVERSTYQLHQIVQEFFRVKLHERSDEGLLLKLAFCKAMVDVAQGIDENLTIDEIARISTSIPHLEKFIIQWVDLLSDEDLILPFQGIGRFYEGQGNYGLALPQYEKCLKQARRRFGTEHPSVAESLNNLAGLYYNQGRYTEAEPLYLQTLEMRQKCLGGENSDVAESLNNLAGLYGIRGRYAEAEPLYLQALEIYKKFVEEENLNAATSLNNLAYLYYNQGRYEEAEPLYMQALEMRQKFFGGEHSSVATSLNNLAALYLKTGRYEEAEFLYMQALEMRQKCLREGHPDIATSLNNLARLYSTDGRYSEAEPLFLQALEMYKGFLGEEHPSVATSLNNLAGFYEDQGRYSEAEPLFLQALEMIRNFFGEEHPDVATSLNNLAALYLKDGRYSEAKPLFLQALEMIRKFFGEEHHDVATIQENLDDCCQKMKKSNR